MKLDRQTTVTGPELGELLGISSRQVTNLVKDGRIPSVANGRYNIRDCFKAYREFKEPKTAKLDDGTVIDFEVEKARKTRAEANLLERKDELEQEKYIPVEEITQDIQDAVSVVARILGNLKLNIARIAPQMPNRALDLIDREQAKAMTAICELDESYISKSEEARKSDRPTKAGSSAG